MAMLTDSAGSSSSMMSPYEIGVTLEPVGSVTPNPLSTLNVCRGYARTGYCPRMDSCIYAHPLPQPSPSSPLPVFPSVPRDSPPATLESSFSPQTVGFIFQQPIIVSPFPITPSHNSTGIAFSHSYPLPTRLGVSPSSPPPSKPYYPHYLLPTSPPPGPVLSLSSQSITFIQGGHISSTSPTHPAIHPDPQPTSQEHVVSQPTSSPSSSSATSTLSVHTETSDPKPISISHIHRRPSPTSHQPSGKSQNHNRRRNSRSKTPETLDQHQDEKKEKDDDARRKREAEIDAKIELMRQKNALILERQQEVMEDAARAKEEEERGKRKQQEAMKTKQPSSSSSSSDSGTEAGGHNRRSRRGSGDSSPPKSPSNSRRSRRGSGGSGNSREAGSGICSREGGKWKK
jgi:hypothetical protein